MNADQLWAKLEEVRATRFAAECELPKNVFHAKVINARKVTLRHQEQELRKAWQEADAKRLAGSGR